jgi:hypothetical protein
MLRGAANFNDLMCMIEGLRGGDRLECKLFHLGFRRNERHEFFSDMAEVYGCDFF